MKIFKNFREREERSNKLSILRNFKSVTHAARDRNRIKGTGALTYNTSGVFLFQLLSTSAQFSFVTNSCLLRSVNKTFGPRQKLIVTARSILLPSVIARKNQLILNNLFYLVKVRQKLWSIKRIRLILKDLCKTLFEYYIRYLEVKKSKIKYFETTTHSYHIDLWIANKNHKTFDSGHRPDSTNCGLVAKR